MLMKKWNCTNIMSQKYRDGIQSHEIAEVSQCIVRGKDDF